MLAYVWAEDSNGLIGNEGVLPWKLPADMKYFVDITTRGDIVSGRLTYESIPKRPLKNRKNFVLTRDEDYSAPGAYVLNSKEEVLELEQTNDKHLYIIGGSDLFKLFEDEVDELYRTVVHTSFGFGDTYFPKSFDYNKFKLVQAIEGVVDEENVYPHTFELWKRRNNG